MTIIIVRNYLLLLGSFEEDTALPKGLESWNKSREGEDEKAEEKKEKTST